MDERTRTNSQSVPPKRMFPNDRLILKVYQLLICISLIVDLPLFVELCAKVAAKWKSIGIQLGVPHYELSSIQGNNRGDSQMIRNCLIDMFHWWLNNGQDVTPKKLAQAIHIVGEHGLEVKIKEKFGEYKPCIPHNYVHFPYAVTILYVGLSLEPCFDIHGHSLCESELPEYVLKYCHDIKMRYIEQSVLPESDWPPTLGGQYIRLALIEQGRTTRDFTYHRVVEFEKDRVRGHYDKILQHKTEIKLEKIFDPVFCEGGYEFPRLKMLIDGAPGAGKTTLSRNVSQKWAKGDFLQEYWLVLLLHLRERKISRAQIIDDFFCHDDQMVQTAVVAFVRETSGRGVLVFFDGFDELSLTQRREHSLFLDIVKGKVLSKCAVVVTSRPYASRPIQELWQSVNRHVEVLGFTNEQIHKCIHQRINNEAKAKELCAELKDRLDIESICQIPLNCSIVLYVYEMEDYRLPDTLTELYELFILHSLRRYATRTQDSSVTEVLHDVHKLPRPIQYYFSILSKLAFEGLKEDRLVFEQGDLVVAFSQTFTGANLPLLDLMTSAKSYSSRGPHDTYSFLHLTVQEYLGAFWAAKNLSGSEKLDFLKENMKNERFYMVLRFFAGITNLNIMNVHTLFNKHLGESDDLVHICRLLYESDVKTHSLCNYVANNCVPKKEINFVQGINSLLAESFKSIAYDYNKPRPRRYSRFDCLMIIHFIAYSSYQWYKLTVKLDDVQLLHKVFNGFKSCHTAIQHVVLEADIYDLFFYEGTINLLDNIPQFVNIKLRLLLAFSQLPRIAVQAESNLRNLLTKAKAIKSIYTETFRGYKFGNFHNVLFEGIACSATLVRNLELQTVIAPVEDVEDLIYLLIKENSNLKLVTLSFYPYHATYCHEENRCNQCCNLISTFLSKNTSLRQIDISLPFHVNQLICCISIIQSGLDQNLTLERLNVNKEIVFKRNEHTSKFELVQGHELYASQSN